MKTYAILTDRLTMPLMLPTTGTLKFDYPIDFKGPDNLSKAATVNLFVWNNYMHDISYAYGFDETNGNFQNKDYGRLMN
jgi:hypothetical protein